MKLTRAQATSLLFGALFLVGVLGVLDYLDGPDASPSPYLVFGLVSLMGLAVGLGPPSWPGWPGGGDRR